MSKDLYEIEFHHGDILIGVGYNLTEKEVNKVWEEWEAFDSNCWCMVVYRVEYEE
jgi:hypothetical protein